MQQPVSNDTRAGENRNGTSRDGLYLAGSTILSWLVTYILLIIPWTHPQASSNDLTIWSHLPLITIEVSLLYAFVYTAVYIATRVINRPSIAVSMWVTLPLHGLIIISILFNAMMHQWAGFGLWSAGGFEVLKRIPNQLIFYANQATIQRSLTMLAFTFGYLCVVHFSVSKCISKATVSFARKRLLHAFIFFVSLALLGCLNQRRNLSELISQAPTRHPLSVFSVVSIQNLGDDPTIVQKHRSSNQTPVTVRSMQDALKEGILRRSNQHRLLQVFPENDHEERQVKVLIVIIESLRPDLIQPDVMPWLAAESSRGIYCTNHLSGGNASMHGVFSIVNGLNAYWYHHPVTHTPLLNRFFRQAGYETGFFSSQNDWRRFQMDGFIDPRHYTVFRSTPYQGVKTDRDTLLAAQQFLSDTPEEGNGSKKRIAVAYLYSTHAPYQSYPRDQNSKPFADDRLSYPYSNADRTLVWNRYCNSARSVDRLLSNLNLQDTTVVVTGDHGEAFLEDETIGHGTKINRWQNRTPLLFLGNRDSQPTSGRIIDLPTSHSDILPTLLGTCGIVISNPLHLDGIDLNTATENQLNARSVVTRDYLREHLCLYPPNTGAVWQNPLAIQFDMRSGSFQLIGEYAETGSIKTLHDQPMGQAILSQWLDATFLNQTPF
ncbi:MAG: sulfatase-like hydrolase/transferase [Rubripirellula sp.]